KYKVYIIDEVHMLSSSAFNAFLKTLEEPPPYAIFILATTEKHKILPTILSRCQIFDFKRITINDTVEHLQDICEKEEITADKAALQVIAQKSEGCMRDALSILDKLVSFTNSEVTYTNTLEHLNILDEDYYFRFLDSLQNQDLPAALLLYDDINRKGFEGDLVLNGFSEFIRNLLVSLDDKAAVLLEVVESFKVKYAEAAKKTSASFLISALNILNEAEINYKAARNKRLHVELALIKLCYLQQALELVNDSNGISKKKLIDSAKPVAFRQIAPIEVKTKISGTISKKQDAKLIIQTPVEERLVFNELVSEYKHPKNLQATQEVKSQAPNPIATGSKLSALSKIREQFKPTNSSSNANEIQPLNDESLLRAWKKFVAQLKEAKNSAAQSFDLALLRIKDENSFDAVTANNLEQKFIEKERLHASSFLQQELNNRSIQFTIIIEEKTENREPLEKTLTSREQFQKMAEQYPLVKELKERLKLDLDY
ncbi:MAG: DNA polymerase III subunit gamma/tau, partial [Bacteroidota bacterium]